MTKQPMIRQHNNARPCKRSWLRALLPVAGAALLFGACNSDSDDDALQTGYVEPSDVAVTGFKLKANSKILSGLDTVYFSIDLQRGLIYNADSLPKDTRVTDLIPVISYSQYISSAVIIMEGGEKRQGEVDYKKNPNDSIDFTGDVKLRLTSSAGNFRTYTLKVNVHTMEPDSLCWGETSVSKLPARLNSPQEQKTVMFNGKATTILQEADGSFTLSTTADPAVDPWNTTKVTPGFTPRLRTLTASGDKLWMLSDTGELYSSADGLIWQPTSHTWYNILGAYGTHLLGLQTDGDSYVIISEDSSIAPHRIPAGFPVEDYTSMYSYQSKWMAEPISVLAGGVTADGKVSSAVWAFDGTSWARLSNSSLPAMRGATLVPYLTYRRTGSSWTYNDFSTMMLIGGMLEDGTLNRDTYLSYDNGVNWSKAPAMLQMPDYIPAAWKADNIVVYKPMQAPLLPEGWNQMPARKLPGWYRISSSVSDGIISWECPYIYLYGGCDLSGTLYNTIWRGVINRLTFTPII